MDNEFASKLSNKEIVDKVMGDFKVWLYNTYGFEASYQELRNITLQVFWSEYIMHQRQKMADEQAAEIAKAQEQAEQETSNEKSTED